MDVTYNWEADRWASLPLGVKVSKLAHFGTVPVQFSIQYEHNFADDAVGPKHTFRFGSIMLLPTR
jgi:hypothetical protein